MNTYFTEMNLISDSLSNILCDQILGHVNEEFKELNFILSGRLGSNLQKDEEIMLKNIVLITDSRQVFDYHASNAKKISPSVRGIVKQQSRTLLYFENLYVEIWFAGYDLEVVTKDGMPIQKLSQIPKNTL